MLFLSSNQQCEGAEGTDLNQEKSSINLIRHQIPEERAVAVFLPILWHQYRL